MNERSKLLDVIRHYLSFDVEMDYMAVFASFLSSEDSSVRCACELLYYISSQGAVKGSEHIDIVTLTQ